MNMLLSSIPQSLSSIYYVLNALERANKEEKKDAYTPHPNEWGMVNRFCVTQVGV